MRRLTIFSLLTITALSFWALHATAQIGGVYEVARKVPILDAQGATTATIVIRRGTLVIWDAQGNEMYRSTQASEHPPLPPLSPPGDGGKADDSSSLRRDVDALAISVRALTDRVNELSAR